MDRELIADEYCFILAFCVFEHCFSLHALDHQGKADVVKMDGKEDAGDCELEEVDLNAYDKSGPVMEPNTKKGVRIFQTDAPLSFIMLVLSPHFVIPADGRGGQHESGSEGTSEIVVSYSDDMEQLDAVQLTSEAPALLKTSSEYATVNEMAVTEGKRKKKMSRSISKSIQNALRPLARRRSQGQGNAKEKHRNTSDSLGFKPRFQSNPLQLMQPGQVPSDPTITTPNEPGDDSESHTWQVLLLPFLPIAISALLAFVN